MLCLCLPFVNSKISWIHIYHFKKKQAKNLKGGQGAHMFGCIMREEEQIVPLNIPILATSKGELYVIM